MSDSMPLCTKPKRSAPLLVRASRLTSCDMCFAFMASRGKVGMDCAPCLGRLLFFCYNMQTYGKLALTTDLPLDCNNGWFCVGKPLYT